MKIFGIGFAAAIMIDVLIVRMVVAPAVMTLLGDRGWWLPGWLDRLLPHVELEGERGRDEPEGDRERERDRRRAPSPQPTAAEAGD